MILGIGLDVVSVARLRRWKDYPGLFKRFFNPEELKVALPRGKAGILSLAARFAAKEAFGKALGGGIWGFSLKEIAVMNDPYGKPYMVLSGNAEKAFNASGASKIFVSLTHEHDNALAMVIIER